MKTREWLMTEDNLIYRDINSFEDLSSQERDNLQLVITELKGWATQSVDLVLSVMAEDGVYYDITGEPAVGHGWRPLGSWLGQPSAIHPSSSPRLQRTRVPSLTGRGIRPPSARQ